MSGVTDAPFRRLTAALGAGLVVSEMTASNDLVNGRPMSRLRCEATGIGPHVVQLAGCEANWMAEGARIAEAAGADIIDINMGCPARHVTGGQSGSALMRDLDHALKTDRGDDRRGESAGDAEDAARLGRSFAQRAGIGAPRGSRRRADDLGAWPHALPVLQGRSRLGRGARGQGCDRFPLVVNGDITSFEKAVTALEMSGADAVMVGRGAQGQPWLPGQIGRRLETGIVEAAPSLAEQLNYIRTLYDEVCSHYGLRIGLRHARKHLGWALEIAAQCSRAPALTLKSWRQKVLTSEESRRRASLA